MLLKKEINVPTSKIFNMPLFNSVYSFIAINDTMPPNNLKRYVDKILVFRNEIITRFAKTYEHKD